MLILLHRIQCENCKVASYRPYMQLVLSRAVTFNGNIGMQVLTHADTCHYMSLIDEHEKIHAAELQLQVAHMISQGTQTMQQVHLDIFVICSASLLNFSPYSDCAFTKL